MDLTFVSERLRMEVAHYFCRTRVSDWLTHSLFLNHQNFLHTHHSRKTSHERQGVTAAKTVAPAFNRTLLRALRLDRDIQRLDPGLAVGAVI